MQFGKTLGFSSLLGIITQTQGAFNFNTCSGIAIDPPSGAFPNGRIFITNRGNSSVSILNYTNPTAGSPTVITTAQGTFNTPTGIAIDPPSVAFPNGRIFVVNSNNTISILNYSNPTAGSPTVITTVQGSFYFGDYAGYIAIDALSNRIFVVNTGLSATVSILNYTNPTAGSPTVITTVQGTFNNPSHVAIDAPNNRIFITNCGNSSVSILNYTNPTAGSPMVITTAQGTFNNPTGIALDAPNNRIFIINRSNSSVSILNYTNPTAGSPTVITTAQGTFSLSYQTSLAIDAPNNQIFVVNANNNTVSILSNIFT